MAADLDVLPGCPAATAARGSPVGAARAAAFFPWAVAGLTVVSVAVCAVWAPEGGNRPARVLAWLLFVGSSVHVAATALLFVFGDVRRHAMSRRGRYVVAPVGLIVTAALASALLNHGLTAAALWAFFAWQFWHYQKQNLGLAALAAAAHRLPGLTHLERRCIKASASGGILALIARPAVLQLVSVRVPAGVAAVTFALAVLVVASASTLMLRACRTRRSGGAGSPGLMAVLLTGVTFPVPLLVSRSPYVAIGGLTLAHGLQYLLLVAEVLAGPPGSRPVWRPSGTGALVLLAATLALAGGLSALSHLHGGSLVARLLFGAYAGVVMTHFVVDAGLWRLRNEFSRRWLTGRLSHLLVRPG